MELAGRTALLTGATGGLGRAIAGALAERGVRLALSARSREAIGELIATLPGEGHVALPCDLCEPGAAERLAAEAAEVELLVANAGLPGTGPLGRFDSERLAATLRVNLEAPILLARALEPAMRQRGGGHMVFISSLSGKSATPLTSVYNATKFGLRGFALGLRAELAPSGIGVSLVSPGFVRDAGMFADSGAKPPPGMGTARPEQVGRAVVRAIERDRAEIAVAPIRQRLLAHFALASPGIAARATSSGASHKAAKSVADGQTDKR